MPVTNPPTTQMVVKQADPRFGNQQNIYMVPCVIQQIYLQPPNQDPKSTAPAINMQTSVNPQMLALESPSP